MTLICRFGADKMEKHLPPLLRAIKREGAQRRVVVRSDAWQHDEDGNRISRHGPSTGSEEVREFIAIRRRKAACRAACILR